VIGNLRSSVDKIIQDNVRDRSCRHPTEENCQRRADLLYQMTYHSGEHPDSRVYEILHWFSPPFININLSNNIHVVYTSASGSSVASCIAKSLVEEVV
jgi:hypothetical protein